MARKNGKPEKNVTGKEECPLEKIVRKLPKHIDNAMIPQIYTPPNTEIVVFEARQKFYTSEELSQSFCQVLESYKNAGPEEPPKQEEKHLETPEPNVENPVATISKHELQKLLNRSVLAEYRKDRGLDKLKDFIKDKIVESCSFERGIKMLDSYIKEKRKIRDLTYILSKQDTLEPLINVEGRYMEEVMAVSEEYPDLTADEVSWLALARPLKEDWIFDRLAPFYYPPALVSMSVDGFDFAFGTIDDEFEDDAGEPTSFKIGGITGIDTQTEHIPLDHNLSQAIKALVVLETEDQDIFDKFWEGEGINAVKRGDAMLIKSFLEGQKEKYGLGEVDLSKTYVQKLIDDRQIQFGRDDVEAIRGQIKAYYYANSFRNDFISNVYDFVKLMGLLKKVPEFIEKQKKFDGYVMFYGGNVEFIDMQGRIESVPLIDYALHEVSFNIHGATIDVNRKNKLMNQVYAELSKRISSKNINEGNLMAIDAIRGKIWDDYEIYIPLDIASEPKKVKELEFFAKNLTSDEHIERTVKFGYNELKTIKELLDSMPKDFSRYVRSIIKMQDPSFSIDTFRTGEVRGGEFFPATGRIEISLPIEVPARFFEETYRIHFSIAETDKEKEYLKNLFWKSQLFDALFQHTLMHEVAESIYPHLSDDWMKNWLELTIKPEEVPGKENEYFLTEYGKRNPREDFCETFATYVIHCQEFKEKGLACPHIKKKYDFMHEFFSGDGKDREYKNRTNIQMSQLHTDPRKTYQQIMIDALVKDTLRSEQRAWNERQEFMGQAMSYSDVEDIIREQEEQGIKISNEKAAEMLQKLEQESEEYDEQEHLQFIIKKLMNRAVLEVHQAGVMNPECGYDLPVMLRKIGEQGTIDYLVNSGATKDKAEACIKKLTSMYQAFPEAYERMTKDLELDDEAMSRLSETVRELAKYIKWPEKEQS